MFWFFLQSMFTTKTTPYTIYVSTPKEAENNKIALKFVCMLSFICQELRFSTLHLTFAFWGFARKKWPKQLFIIISAIVRSFEPKLWNLFA